MLQTIRYIIPICLGFVGGIAANAFGKDALAQERKEPSIIRVDNIQTRQLEVVDENGVVLGYLKASGKGDSRSVSFGLGVFNPDGRGSAGFELLCTADVTSGEKKERVAMELYGGKPDHFRLLIGPDGIVCETRPDEKHPIDATWCRSSLNPHGISIQRKGGVLAQFGIPDRLGGAELTLRDNDSIPRVRLRSPAEPKEGGDLQLFDMKGALVKAISEK